jgi:ABC-type phosphate/phosphonate transport system substrate-binding protein
VDGNVIVRRSLSEIADLAIRKQIAYHPDLPADLMEKIQNAILASPVIEDEDKELIRKPSNQ